MWMREAIEGGIVCTCQYKDFSQLSKIGDNICGGDGARMHPYAYPQHQKVLKPPCICTR